MPLIEWTDQLTVNYPQLDDTHHDFVALVNKIGETTDKATFQQLFNELVTHTEAHFNTENQLMQQTQFSATAEHQGEHHRVLGELKQFQKRVARGMVDFGRAYVKERLPEWFALHTATMDSALAAHLRQKGV